ncbi:mediator complex subunit MED14-domain-containing protein [Aspergillus karnatakaensis]|uniref:mediator of RNA polymerase II transcription subunit 14 n=1 Tax=Aspergillus karnatakaensis TaxID=1810916 RepID=UPI003CCD33E9
MPGVVMDRNQQGGRGPDLHGHQSGIPFSEELYNGLRTNGVRHVSSELSRIKVAGEPPEIEHITQGFFPFSKLVNRSVQQCWNDLADLVNELAEIQLQDTPAPVKQSPENVHKKLRALEFTQAKRGDFIKLLVLSQWSRQATDVSKLIDIQNYIRIQHQAYTGALQTMGDMKRDLVRAQVANPDLKTALEVLSKGGVTSMPDLGYKSPKPLTPKSTLRKFRKINRVISTRLTLHENTTHHFQTYKVHDGRVSFVVPKEFELDLSIGEEDITSQFFFVDIRFLFKPSSSIPAGRMFTELDFKVNGKLRNEGLTGCFDWLHNLALTMKINILTRQATDLARGLWSSVLRVELLHRTLVLHYWASKPGTKSWLEIGIQFRKIGEWPSLGLRWMRDGQPVESHNLEFDTENISVECLLRSVIASHISHILSSAFGNINGKLLYSGGSLSLRAHLYQSEPADCHLSIQLTASRRLRVAIEPMSGTVILAATPNLFERVDSDRNVDRPIVDELVSRVGRLRCAAAIEEVESQVKMLGFESINPRYANIDTRRLFPTSVLRFSFFSHRCWNRTWLLAATTSMDGDSWWVVNAAAATADRDRASAAATVVCPALWPRGPSSVADLGHCLAGFLAIYANARFLEDLQLIKIYPSLEQLKFGSSLQVPDLNIQYEATKLPQMLQISVPAGIKKKIFIRDTLRLRFSGFTRHKNVAVMVAYGRIGYAIKAAVKDDNLVFQKTDKNELPFALRMLSPPGHPIIINLFQNLQRLEYVLSIHETLVEKKMAPRSLSLSHIDFAYGPEKNLLARIEINESDISSTTRLFRLRLGIKFDSSNPHRRIQNSLASGLNHPTTDAGLDSTIDLLPFTLPLMRAFNRLTSGCDGLKVHVIVRSARSFQIHYPLEGWRFQLVAHQHQNQPVWVLKDVVRGTGEHKLHESLYNSKGTGWRGLGNGAIADAYHVGNLLDELDRCLASVRAAPATKVDAPTAPAVQGTHQAQSAALQKADVIMID